MWLLPGFCLAQQAATSSVYQENKLWGLANEKPITPAVYDTLIAITNESSWIAKKHKAEEIVNSMGVISEKGKIIIPFKYLSITPSQGDYIVQKWVNNEVVYGVLSQSNKPIINIRYKNILPLSNYWVVQSSQEIHLYNNMGGMFKKIVSDSVLLSPHPDFIITYHNGKSGLVNKQGLVIYAPQFKSINYKNNTWITTEFSKWEIISNTDTTTVYTDSLQIWDRQTYVSGINGNYYVERKNKSLSKTYQSINIIAPSFAISKKAHLYGVITKTGAEVLPPNKNRITYKKGYFYTYKNKFWDLYDSLGNKRSVFRYDSIGTIEDGLFPIKRKGKWGFMNRNGQEVIHCIYDSNAQFKNGKAIIKYYGANGIIDPQGNWIVKPIYENITGYSFNFFIYKENGTYYLKNYQNELIYFSNHKLIFKGETIYEVRASKKNEISAVGTLVKIDTVLAEDPHHWRIIKVGEKYGFEDVNGLLKITYRYDSLKPFTENLAAFKLRGKWGFINSSEEIVIQPHYNAVTPFKNGFTIITKKGKMGLLRPDGKFILKPKFDAIHNLQNDLWLVKEDGFTGLFNSKGNIIIQPKYEQITYINENLIILLKNGIYGAVDIKGISVLPRAYHYIGYDKRTKQLLLKKSP